MTTTTTADNIDKVLNKLVPEWARLLRALKADIGDDYRASDDPDDTTPGMCVTIGATWNEEDQTISWSYQTGDNSYSGGAYGHPAWAMVSLYRRSNSRELAADIANQIGEAIAQ